MASEPAGAAFAHVRRSGTPIGLNADAARGHLSGRNLSTAREACLWPYAAPARCQLLGLQCVSVAHASELLSARSSHRRSVSRGFEAARAHRGATADLDA
eukprot:3855518-Prymnesium_polylepis.1